MTPRESIPAWIVRQQNRRTARYPSDKVVRWIALPNGKRRTDPPSAHGESSNDNVVVFTRGAHTGS